MKIESTVGLDFCAVAVDDAVFRAGFGADGYGLAEKVDIAVAGAGVGAIGDEDGVAVIG